MKKLNIFIKFKNYKIIIILHRFFSKIDIIFVHYLNKILLIKIHLKI